MIIAQEATATGITVIIIIIVSSDKRPKHNLCAYATRDMVGGKSKWFGLTKLLQTGWAAGIITNTPDDPRDLYWKPPPPEYYKK
jgi:hypothetical protein